MRVELDPNQESANSINQFVSRLVEVDNNRISIGSYVNCLKKQFSLSKLPWNILSKQQTRREMISSFQKLWAAFFSSIPSEVIKKSLECLDLRIQTMYKATPEDYSTVDKDDYIYIQFITPLHLAAWCGCLEFVDLIQTQYLPVWKEYMIYPDLLGNLPIHCCFFAFDYWSEPIDCSVQLASRFQSTLTVRNVVGFTPLHIACLANQSKGVLYLREQDIDLSIPVHFFDDNFSELLDQIDTLRDICQLPISSYHSSHHSLTDSVRCGSCSSFYGGSLCSYEGSFEDRFGLRESEGPFLLTAASTSQSRQYELEGFYPIHLALLADAPYCAFLLLRSVEDLLHTSKAVPLPLEVLSLHSYALFSFFSSLQVRALFHALPKEWHSMYSPTQDLLQSTLLNGIISRNYTSIIKILSTNINLNANYFMHSFSPLHIVCVLLDETFIRLFIGYGANPCKLTADKDSCLHLILKSQSKVIHEMHKSKLLGLLIMSGGDPNVCDSRGYPPLYYAVKSRFFRMVIYRQCDFHAVRVLLAYGADPAQLLPSHFTIFHLAIQIGNEELVRLLFNHSPGLLNVPAKNGHHPLYYVIRNNQLALFVYLLNHTSPLSDKAIADMEMAFHNHTLTTIYECVKKQIGFINHTCTNVNRYQLNFFLPNNKVDQCMQCHKRFSLITVRKHCRRCGQVLCSGCCQDDADKTKDHICNKCRKMNLPKSSLLFLQQFEDGIKSYLVKIPHL